MRPSEWTIEFAAALLDPVTPIPGGMHGPGGVPSVKRFAVYRNNVVAGLIDALRETFPVTLRIVGREFFDAAARIYVGSDPPRSPILLEYGSGFASFLDQFEPASSVPYLGDVCRIERAWLEAYHAAEADPIDPSDLRMALPSEISELRIDLHPSIRLIRSTFPALTIWETNVNDGLPVPVDLGAGGQDILIGRPYADVESRRVSRGAFDFVHALLIRTTVRHASRIALAADPGFSLSNTIEALLDANLIVNYRTTHADLKRSRRSSQ